MHIYMHIIYNSYISFHIVSVLLTATNSFSVILSSRIQIIFMIGKVAALVVIIVGGIVKLIQGKIDE